MTQSLPEGLVLLDYFEKRFRFGNFVPTGTPPTSINYSTSQDTRNLTFLQYQKHFPNGMPYARFDNDAGTSYQYLLEGLLNSDGFTVEFFVYLENTYWADQYLLLSDIAKSKNFLPFALNNKFAVGYTSKSIYSGNENWYFNGELSTNKSLPSNTTSSRGSWYHVEVSVKGRNIRFFFNGKMYAYNNSFTYNLERILLRGYLCDTNDANHKVGAYRIAQLAVWNYIRHESDFDVSNKLILDM